jgi:hypothetical protein
MTSFLRRIRNSAIRNTRWNRRNPAPPGFHSLIGARLGYDAWRAWKALSDKGPNAYVKWSRQKFLPGNTPHGPVNKKPRRAGGFSGLTSTQQSLLRKRKYRTPTGQMSEDLQRKVARHGKYRAHKLSRNRLKFATPF